MYLKHTLSILIRLVLQGEGAMLSLCVSVEQKIFYRTRLSLLSVATYLKKMIVLYSRTEEFVLSSSSYLLCHYSNIPWEYITTSPRRDGMRLLGTKPIMFKGGMPSHNVAVGYG